MDILFYNNIVIVQYYGLLYLFKMMRRGCCKCFQPPGSAAAPIVQSRSPAAADFLRGLLRWPTLARPFFYILLLFYLFTVKGWNGVCSTARHRILYYNVIYYNRGARLFFFFSHANEIPFKYDIIINSNVTGKN